MYGYFPTDVVACSYDIEYDGYVYIYSNVVPNDPSLYVWNYYHFSGGFAYYQYDTFSPCAPPFIEY